jgi:WD40 repeat protein
MSTLPPSPYKGLAAFGDSELDALLFFGREREQQAIVANVLANRLTVLFGPSGVGKSSLLAAGVAQRLRALEAGTVVVHGAWAGEPDADLAAAVHDGDPELGPTAGLVDTVAAAAQRHGEVYLLLDQFEEYFFHHGADGPLAELLPELLRRSGLRVNVLLALRDDGLAELDALAGRLPELYGNMLRLDRLDRRAGRAAIVGPLDRYGELAGETHRAEPPLVEALLDEVAAGRVDFGGTVDAPAPNGHVEAPFLQLVLERLWADERAAGSRELRLETFRRLGGAAPIVREHVQGTLGRLPPAEQDVVARLVRHLVTPSGAKTSHTAADLAEYSGTAQAELLPLLTLLTAARITRVVEGSAGRPVRYEIFHDVLAEPLLTWRGEHEVERERVTARRQRRRLRAIVAAALVALVIVGAVAVFALVQRSHANAQARSAHARALAAQALAGIPENPAASVARALHASELSGATDVETVLRSSLLAMRERRVLRLGGAIVAAQFAPLGGRLFAGAGTGAAGVYDASGRSLVRLPRQPGLTRAAWSADGRLVATGDAGGTVTIWRASDGRELERIATPAPVTVLAFTPHGLLTASGAHVRIVRDPGAAASVRTIRVNGAVVAAALSPDGRLLAVAVKRAGRDTAAILDAGTGRPRAVLRERGIGSLGFSADGRLLVTGSTDKTARLWDAHTGRRLHVLPQKGHIVAEQFSPDGRELVTSSADGSAAVWNVRTGVRRLLLVGSTGVAEAAAYSPDGKEIAVAFGDGVARIYSSDDGRILAPLAGHTDAVTSVGYASGGTSIVTGSNDGTVRLWSADAGDQLQTIDHAQSSVVARFAGADVLTVAGSTAHLLRSDGRLLERERMPAPIVAIAAHGTAFALADEAGNLLRRTSASGTSMTSGFGIRALAYAPDGTLIAGSRDGTIRLFAPGGAVIRSIRGAQPVVELSAAAGRFAARAPGGTVRVYRTDGSLLRTLTARAQLATIAPDGAVVATATAREADLWDVATGRLAHRLRGHRSLVRDAEFSPDSAILVTTSDDHDSRSWDVATGRLLHVFRGHFFPVRTASFSADGRWIVTASQFTAGLWDAGTGRLVLYLQGHTRPLTGATFSPAGDTILTGSDDGTARIVVCDICRNLAGLQQLARDRLRTIR